MDSEHKLLLVNDLGRLTQPTGDNKLPLSELVVIVELFEHETLPTWPLLLVVLELPPLFHSLGHSEYC